MISVFAATFVFCVGGLVAALCTLALRRGVGKEVLKSHHETLIYYASTLTALYGLLIAFVILALWEQQNETAENTVLEASTVQTLARLGDELPQSRKSQIRRAARDYLGRVVKIEWDAMHRNDLETFSREPEELNRLWASWLAIEPQTERESIILTEAMRQLDILRRTHRLRISDAQDSLIPYLWLVLGLGAGLILLTFMFIGMEFVPSQVFLTAICGGWLTVLLFVVYDLQNPFRGYWVVGPDPYRQALVLMEDLSPR